jgi:hypothetical protein
MEMLILSEGKSLNSMDENDKLIMPLDEIDV